VDASFRIKPFAFDRIFAMPNNEPPLAADDLRLQIASLEAEAALMRADHEALLAKARMDGFQAGLTQARAEQGAALLAAVDALQSSLELTDGRVEEITTRVSEDAAQVALAAAETLAGRAMTQTPAVAIDEAIGRALRQVARGQEILVRVHPSLVEEVERMIGVRQSGDRRRLSIQIIADERLMLADAHIEWDQGGLTLDAAERAAMVHAELETLLHGG
jgi:flagellar assembly protein FliH